MHEHCKHAMRCSAEFHCTSKTWRFQMPLSCKSSSLDNSCKLKLTLQVCGMLLPVLKGMHEEEILLDDDSCTSQFSIRLCKDAACWNLLSNAMSCNVTSPGLTQMRCSSTSDAALLWEDTRGLVHVRPLVPCLIISSTDNMLSIA